MFVNEIWTVFLDITKFNRPAEEKNKLCFVATTRHSHMRCSSGFAWENSFNSYAEL